MYWFIPPAVLLICLLLILPAWCLFRFTCVRKPETATPKKLLSPEFLAGQEWMSRQSPEPMEIIAFDGLSLHGMLYSVPKPKGTVIAFHGYRSRYDIDFAPQARFYARQGYNLLLPMQRAHPGSEGKYITFGVKERFDAKLWVYRITEHFGHAHPIVLAGISMGASTVLMAGQLALPDNVQGLIADCGFTTPWAIIRHVAKRYFHLPPFPLLYLANGFARAFAAFDFRDASAPEALEVNPLPVLFIHGDADHFVPMDMSEKNYEACISPKKLLIIPNAGHASAYSTDPDTYQKAVKEFLHSLPHGKTDSSPSAAQAPPQTLDTPRRIETP